MSTLRNGGMVYFLLFCFPVHFCLLDGIQFQIPANHKTYFAKVVKLGLPRKEPIKQRQPNTNWAVLYLRLQDFSSTKYLQ